MAASTHASRSGRPGAYATKLAFRRGLAFLAVLASATAAVYLLWETYPAAAAVVAAAALPTLRHLKGRTKAAWRGASTERRVVRTIRRHPKVEKVWCGLRPGDYGADIDLVARTKSGAYWVVEIKSGYGALSYRNGVLWAGRRRIPGDPVAQVEKAAERAARHFRSPMWRVVCVPGATSSLNVRGTLVCGLRELADAIDRKG